MTGPDLFPAGTYKDIRPGDKIPELERELKFRRRVYPRLVGQKKLDPVKADKQILILQAIIADYRNPRIATLEKLLEKWDATARGSEALNEETRKILGRPERSPGRRQQQGSPDAWPPGGRD